MKGNFSIHHGKTNNRVKGKILLFALACILLISTLIYQQFSNKEDILRLLQKAEPKTIQFKEIPGVYKTYELLDTDGDLLNYGIIASASGYGGPITMLTLVDQYGKIVNAMLLGGSETPLYFRKALEAGYPENLIGKTVTQPLANQPGIDAVSGATRTVQGVMLAVEKGMYQIGEKQLGLQVPAIKTFYFQWRDGVVILLLIFAIFAAVLNMRKLRPWILVTAVFILGFMENNSLTIGNYASLLAMKMPALLERPIWYVMVIGVFVATLAFGRNIYCLWLCPFGAVQEGIYRALNLTNYRPNPKLIAIARKNRWLFLWLALMLAFLFNNPSIASYEPFAVFFDGRGNNYQWIIMGTILLFSIFILRFWCRIFCPVGVFLDFVSTSKRKAKRIFKKIKLLNWSEKKNNSFVENVANTSCNKQSINSTTKQRKLTLSTGDKILAGSIVAIWILIIATLVQNTGLFHIVF